MTDALILSRATLASLSEAARAELLQLVLAPPASPSVHAPDDEQPFDLSLAQGRKLIEGCGPKIRDALRAMIEAGESGFTMDAVANALNADIDAGELRGVWGGLTKRIRTVLGDPEAYLILWEELPEGWHGRFSPTTYQSLRRAMNL